MGDDIGAGNLFYPEHPVYIPGLFDLVLFEVSVDDESVFFDFQFKALTNPFGAPEGYFHQRLELLLSTGSNFTHNKIHIGRHTLQTAPKIGWDVRLSIAPFGESLLYVGEELQIFREDIVSSVLPDGRTIRLKVPKSLLPHPNLGWGYYVLVGAFDGLAPGLWRDVGKGSWQIRGEGVPVFDLLAPLFSLPKQKVQLTKGVLYPVYGRQNEAGIWFVCGFIVILTAFFLWRWVRGRT